MRLNVVGPKAELDKLRPKLEPRFEPKTFHYRSMGNVLLYRSMGNVLL